MTRSKWALPVRVVAGMAAAWVLAGIGPAQAARDTRALSFAVVAPEANSAAPEEAWRHALAQAERQHAAFIVLSGIKSAFEPCADRLYAERREVLDELRTPAMLSVTAADWIHCRREDGSSMANDRLNHLREIFFPDPATSSRPGFQVVRQSAARRYSAYQENMRWELQGVLFATLNVPSDNNHYLPDAGRNGEFEDRVIANRAWLERVLHAARSRKTRAVVLFFEGDPGMHKPVRAPRTEGGMRDGYAELRRQLRELAAVFPGRVLLVHRAGNPADAPVIQWRGNLGELRTAAGWTLIRHDLRSGNFSARAGE